jgi:hypothetical protein
MAVSKIKGGTLATVATGEVEIAIRPVSEGARSAGGRLIRLWRGERRLR